MRCPRNEGDIGKEVDRVLRVGFPCWVGIADQRVKWLETACADRIAVRRGQAEGAEEVEIRSLIFDVLIEAPAALAVEAIQRDEILRHASLVV